jgi:hypothetical protein
MIVSWIMRVKGVSESYMTFVLGIKSVLHLQQTVQHRPSLWRKARHRSPLLLPFPNRVTCSNTIQYIICNSDTLRNELVRTGEFVS